MCDDRLQFHFFISHFFMSIQTREKKSKNRREKKTNSWLSISICFSVKSYRANYNGCFLESSFRICLEWLLFQQQQYFYAKNLPDNFNVLIVFGMISHLCGKVINHDERYRIIRSSKQS